MIGVSAWGGGEEGGLNPTDLEGRYLKSSSWKSTLSSFLHLVFLTRAERLLAVSPPPPLSSRQRFRLGALFSLSVSDTSGAAAAAV